MDREVAEGPARLLATAIGMTRYCKAAERTLCSGPFSSIFELTPRANEAPDVGPS